MTTFLMQPPEISSFSGRRLSDTPIKCFSNISPRNLESLSMVKHGTKVGARVRVCSSIRDFQVRVSDLRDNVAELSSNQNKGDGEKQDYYVNLGYAIRTIREEVPQLFYQDLNFDIYRDDIIFKDPLNTFIGIENYKSILWALRFHGQIFFKALWIDIGSIWQPMENVIMVRWTVHGVPRVPWETHGRFDATSEYKLDKEGKIFEHRVDNIALNSPPKFTVLMVEELIQALGCPSTPKPTYYEISHSLGEIHFG